jgi:hypothetical protein
LLQPAKYTISSDNRYGLSPLELATGLPILHINYPITLAYRRLSTIPDQTLHTRRLIIVTLSLLVSLESNGKVKPGDLWETSQKLLSSYIEDNGRTMQGMREVQEVISDVVKSVEQVCAGRGGTKSEWFSGDSWNRFMDLRIGLARRVSGTSHIPHRLVD